MIRVYTPRPYQLDCLAALAKAREDGVKKGLVVMASGLGKTLTAAFDVRQFLEVQPNARVLCLCHQEEILLQSKHKFQKVFGEEYSYGLYTGNYKTRHAVSFLFATFQTMRDHREEFPNDAFAYILVDEAHHTSAETYQPTVDYFAPQFLLGLTATKDRMDGQDILDTYEQVLYEMDIYDGWNQDWLARVDYRIMLDDLNQEEFEKYVGPSAAGEKVSLSQLNRTIFAPQRDEDIVKSIREQLSDLENPSIFVFCSSIDHAKNMAYHFGGEAAVIHSGQSSALNETVLSEFRAGKLRVVISVNMLNEGIDVPETDAVVFLRSTESSTVFFQQLGRGLRTGATKRTVRVLDFVANLERISTILEMEETAKKRLPPIPTSSASPKPDPLIVNIPATKFRVQRIDIVSILSKVQRRKNWTKEEIIAGLKAMSSAGLKVTAETINQNPDLPHSTTIMSMFDGSLNNALREAGLRLNQSDRVVFAREAVILEGKRMVDCGTRITCNSIDQNANLPHSATIAKEFGSVLNFATLCGQDTIAKDTSKEGMLKAYWQESKKLSRWLTSKEIDRHPELTYAKKYKDEFGSIAALIRLAEETYGPVISAAEHEEEVREELQATRYILAKEFYEASIRMGHWLTKDEFRRKNGVSSMSRYNRYFKGGIRAIIEFTRELFGDLPGDMVHSQQTQYKSDTLLIKEYWQESEKAGHWLSAAEVAKNQRLASDVTYYYRFGGMTLTRERAIAEYGDFTKENN